MRYIEASNTYEIGYFTGKYWGDYFFNISNNKITTNSIIEISKQFLFYLDGVYKVDENVSLYYKKLKTNKSLSSIFDEMTGITKGFNDSAYAKNFNVKISEKLVFEFCCGELLEYFDDKTGNNISGHCTSAVTHGKNQIGIIHSEEYCDGYCPLLSLTVNINGKLITSVSYPMQLLGSSCGMNKNIIFQGNSIYREPNINLSSTQNKSIQIPKTFFTRKLLDFESISEIKQFLTSYGHYLPNHNFIICDGVLYSCNIFQPGAVPMEQGNSFKFEIIPLKTGESDFHTNHFLSGEAAKKQRKDDWRKDSILRLNFIRRALNNENN